MPGPSSYLLVWLEEQQCYQLRASAQLLQSFKREDEARWLDWVAEHNTFAFEGYAGHLSVIKESRSRGAGYWYAYSRQAGRTRKRYLGRNLRLTFQALEEMAFSLTYRQSLPVSRRAISKPVQETFPNAAAVAHTRSHYLSVPLASIPLLETRFHFPRLPALLVERAHLLALLDRGQQHKLTLISAPAGFGKTTLITQWIVTRQSSDRPLGWISLEHGDNDPVRFWSSVISVCQRWQADLGQTALALLSQMPRTPFTQSTLETALTFLLNDLTHAGIAGILVLEDYQFIEHARIHETLAFFIEHVPASVQVVMLTRSEPPLPLLRWRAHGELLEVQSSHLRFSIAETAIFLQQIIPQIHSDEAVHVLHRHLEGWAAGLRLLALSLQGHVKPQAVEEAIKQLSPASVTNWTHRDLQDFFLKEVFSVQPEPLQHFLLQTSMFDHLTSSLCDSVTGRKDSVEWLELAEHAGLLVASLDNQGLWHCSHSLFAEIIRTEARRRLGADELQTLLAAASHWYEERAMLVEAIEAALAARELERAARLIEKLNEQAYFTEYHTMCRWLEHFSVPVLSTYPGLCFLSALAHFFSEDGDSQQWWRIEPVEDWLRMAEAGWRKQGDLQHLGILYAFRATFTVIHGQTTSAVVYARQALPLLSSLLASDIYAQRPPEWIEWHCGCLMALSMEAMDEGNFRTAYHFLPEAYTLSLRNQDHVFTRVIARLLGDVCSEMGELQRAASYYQQALDEEPVQDKKGEAILQVGSLAGQIQLFLEWHQTTRAEQLLREASSYMDTDDASYGKAYMSAKIELLRLQLVYAAGNSVEAQTGLNALFVRLQRIFAMPLPLFDVLVLQARLQLRSGDLMAAKGTLGRLSDYHSKLTPLQEHTLQLLQARFSLLNGDPAAALPILERLLTVAQQCKRIARGLEIQLLLALVYDALKQRAEARQQLQKVLMQARTESFMRLFLNEGEPLIILLRSLLPVLKDKALHAYAQRILATCISSAAIDNARERGGEKPLIEPLSAQEQRVLRLLSAGRSNPEIAVELVVSVNTVKAHVKSIYRKLGVANRLEAVQVARHENLISH